MLVSNSAAKDPTASRVPLAAAVAWAAAAFAAARAFSAIRSAMALAEPIEKAELIVSQTRAWVLPGPRCRCTLRVFKYRRVSVSLEIPLRVRASRIDAQRRDASASPDARGLANYFTFSSTGGVGLGREIHCDCAL